jgi:hypothetical protein
VKFVKDLNGGYRKPSKWQRIGEQLRDHPNLWGEVTVKSSRRTAYSTVSNIRNRTVNLGPGKYEARAQQQGPSKYAVYVRFVPDTDKAACHESD